MFLTVADSLHLLRLIMFIDPELVTWRIMGEEFLPRMLMCMSIYPL